MTATIIAAAIGTCWWPISPAAPYLEARRANARIDALEHVLTDVLTTIADGSQDIVRRLDRLEKPK